MDPALYYLLSFRCVALFNTLFSARQLRGSLYYYGNRLFAKSINKKNALNKRCLLFAVSKKLKLVGLTLFGGNKNPSEVMQT